MFRSAFGVIVYLAAVANPASSANLPPRDVTADGAWDCKQQDGAHMGAVAIVEKNYAFIKPDGKLGGYGKLYLLVDDLDLPVFAIASGYLKDKLGATGFKMSGPKKTPFDYTGELYMYVSLSTKGDSPLDWECVRRKAPGA